MMRNLWRVAAVFALVFLSCSCTAGTFTKPGGVTDAQFKKDDYECSREAAMSGLGFETLASLGMRKTCLEARGYVMVK